MFTSQTATNTTPLMVLLIGVFGLLSGCNWVALLSVNDAGEQGNDISIARSVSEDGRYVVFDSTADNLVADDFNTQPDVFVHDTVNGTTVRVSVDSDGNEAIDGGYIQTATISGDGRYIGFPSAAANLVADDQNFTDDVFIHDIQTRITTRVSVGPEGVEANDPSFGPSISNDGKYLAFTSAANNLVEGDTDPGYKRDIFVRDLISGVNSIVSVDSAGNQGNSRSFNSSISGDGRYIAFESLSNNLVLNDTNSYDDIFVHDRTTGTTTRVSVSSEGIQGNYGSNMPSISNDGRYVGFVSRASTLVTDDTNSWNDIFVHDRNTGETTRVSVDSDGGQSNGPTYVPSISADGRYVAFDSAATNLVPDDTNSAIDIFIHDRETGITRRVSTDAMGVESNGSSYRPSLSADGHYIIFDSQAGNLVSNDINGSTHFEVFIKAVPGLTVTSVTPDTLNINDTTSVEIKGTNFLSGAAPILDGAECSNIVVVDENTITADVAVQAGASEGLQDLSVGLPGTGPGAMAGSIGACTDCVTYIEVNCGCGCP
jgi:hypothetical protein